MSEDRTIPGDAGLLSDPAHPLTPGATEAQTRPAALSPAWTVPQVSGIRLLRELGRGQMDVVFLGHHRLLDRRVAVKFLTGGHARQGGDRLAGRFLEEAKAAAAVQDPHLSQIHHADLCGDGGGVYLVMEFVDGPTLAGLLARAAPLSPALSTYLLSDVASGVAQLHRCGVIHRDLKPSNVLLDRAGRVVVSDFGLAIFLPKLGSSGDLGATIAGTPGYMAPEMFDGRVSPRGDVYALGIMLYEMLAGHLPFTGTLEEIRSQHQSRPLPIEELEQAGGERGLLDVLERATHKQSMFRFKTASELQRALAVPSATVPSLRRELTATIARALGEDAGTASVPDEHSPAGSSSYTDAIARIAQATRERRQLLASTRFSSDAAGQIGSDAAEMPAPLPLPELEAPRIPIRPIKRSKSVIRVPDLPYLPGPEQSAILRKCARRILRPGHYLVGGLLILIGLWFGAALCPWLMTRLLGVNWILVGNVVGGLLGCTAVAGLLGIWLTKRLGQAFLNELRTLGRCTGCGYDVRQSSERCPECGAPIKAGADKPA